MNYILGNTRKEGLIKLIEQKKDPALADWCIEHREELDLYQSEIISIINIINDKDFTDKYIAKRREFDFKR